MSSPLVIVEEIEAKKGRIVRLILNQEKALNSLNLEMIRLLREQLDTWREDKTIACIILSGSGEKAFCAGGDVQALYESSLKPKDGVCEYAETFFLEEYQLNYLIHTYEKPIICLGKGIVMGGGLGLMAGASHRVVTETSRIAMPEITIGLFPDVGGTYFLSRMPRGLGIFFALTGASINATDALTLGIADHFVANEKLESLQSALATASWKTKDNHALVSQIIDELDCENSVDSNLSHHETLLEGICQTGGLGDIVHDLNSIKDASPWLSKAIATMNAGSPQSMLVIFEQLRRFRYASLKEVFSSELILATNLVRHPEFAEGVRALLIDKDKKPVWQHAHFSAVSASEMEALFTPPWSSNPITDLL